MPGEARREPTDPGLDRIARAAAKHDFPVNILCWGNVYAGTAVIDRHPIRASSLTICYSCSPHATGPGAAVADLPKVLDLASARTR